MPTISRAEFWEGEHRQFDATSGKTYHNLSGYGLPAYEGALKVKDLLPGVRTVLEVGVGTCSAIRDLVKLGKEVSALDVSTAALNRALTNGATRVYSDPGQLPANHFDLVLCHLVAQHAPEDDFFNLCYNVIRALTPTGVFSVQTSDVPRADKSAFNFTGAGNILRGEKEMRDVLSRAGAQQITKVSEVLIVPEQDVSWLGFHARRCSVSVPARKP